MDRKQSAQWPTADSVWTVAIKPSHTALIRLCLLFGTTIIMAQKPPGQGAISLSPWTTHDAAEGRVCGVWRVSWRLPSGVATIVLALVSWPRVSACLEAARVVVFIASLLVGTNSRRDCERATDGKRGWKHLTNMPTNTWIQCLHSFPTSVSLSLALTHTRRHAEAGGHSHTHTHAGRIARTHTRAHTHTLNFSQSVYNKSSCILMRKVAFSMNAVYIYTLNLELERTHTEVSERQTMSMKKYTIWNGGLILYCLHTLSLSHTHTRTFLILLLFSIALFWSNSLSNVFIILYTLFIYHHPFFKPFYLALMLLVCHAYIYCAVF